MGLTKRGGGNFSLFDADDEAMLKSGELFRESGGDTSPPNLQEQRLNHS